MNRLFEGRMGNQNQNGRRRRLLKNSAKVSNLGIVNPSPIIAVIVFYGLRMSSVRFLSIGDESNRLEARVTL